jgi:hypothetical protein
MGFFAPSRLATLGVRSVLPVAFGASPEALVAGGATAGDVAGAVDDETASAALVGPASPAFFAVLDEASSAPASLVRPTVAESAPASPG